METLLRSKGIPEEVIAALVHAGCLTIDDFQYINDELLDSLNITKTFVRKKLLQLKSEQVPASAQIDEVAALLRSVNILPEKCEKYALLLAKEGFDTPAKLAMVTEEDLAAVGISSLYDVRLILGLTKASEAIRPNGRRLSAVAKAVVAAVSMAKLPSPPPIVEVEQAKSALLPYETPMYTLLTPFTKGQESYEEISIISLNMLADYNLQNSRRNPEDMRYKHMLMEQCQWESRFRNFRKWFLLHINEGNVDVFCLQEVDFDLFHSHVKPFLERQAFTCWHQWDAFEKNGEPKHPFGVAICFRKEKFRETFRESRSRTMMIGLATPKTEWFVVNCHLEADANKTDKRMAQISSTLFHMSIHAKLNPRTAKVIVVGDFNSSREDPAFQWLVQQSSVTVKDKEFAPHAFHFHDAYQNADKEVYEAMTYADPMASYRVDHILFTVDTCVVMETLRIPKLERDTTERWGIFYDEYPTDHYPVGCIVHALPPPPPLDEEKKAESEELTLGQMRVLEFLEAGAPVRTKAHGKPSPVELAAIRAHTQSVNVFLSHLNKAQKAWVAKWRKKHRPAVATSQDPPPPAVPGKTRSASFTDIGALFEDKVKITFDLPPSRQQEAKPANAKSRRATLEPSKSAMF